MAMPTFFDFIQNINTTMVYGLAMVRVILMGVGFVWFVISVLNLRVATLGEGAKLIPSQARPTPGGSVLQMIIAFSLILFAYNMTVAAVVGALFNDNMAPIQMYSVASYNPNPTSEDFRDFLRQFATNILYFMGILAIYRGLSAWYRNSDGSGNTPASKIIWHIILGGLCFFPEFLVGVLSSVLGFDVLSIVFGKR